MNEINASTPNEINSSKPLEATILFADMVDSSTLSHVLLPSAYDKIVSDFQRTAAEVVAETIEAEPRKPSHVEASVRGDELSLILVDDRPATGEQQADDAGMDESLNEAGREMHLCTRLALQIAVRLKRRWLLVDENQRRIRDTDQPPLGIAIGIHSGPVLLGEHIRFESGKLQRGTYITAEGYAINLAKRVETASRAGRFSRIFLTRPIYNRTPADFRQAFVRVDAPQLKGILQAPVIYEAKGIGHFDDNAVPSSNEFVPDNLKIYESVVKANPDEIWLLLDLAHKYFDDGDYSKAAKKYEAVIATDPEFAAAYGYLGRSHFRDLRFMEAESALERSVELDPGQGRANNFLAVCLRRNALVAFGRGSKEKAAPLFERAVSLHERALRIAKLQGMLEDFPWAQNGLNYTIAYCRELGDKSPVMPYKLEEAYENSCKLAESLGKSPRWQMKRHLVEHVSGFLACQLDRWHRAEDHFKKSLEGLDSRRATQQIDEKGYAEQKAEVLFHQGLVRWRMGADDHASARDIWLEAKETIRRAWSREPDRAWNEQYWSDYPLKEGEGYTSLGVVLGTPGGRAHGAAASDNRI